MNLPKGFWDNREWDERNSGHYYTYSQVAQMLSKELKLRITTDKVKGWARKNHIPVRYLTRSEEGKPRRYIDSFNVKRMAQYISEWLKDRPEKDDNKYLTLRNKCREVFKRASFSEIDPVEILRNGVQLRTAEKYMRDQHNISATTMTLRRICAANKCPYEIRRSSGAQGKCYIIHQTTLDEIAEACRKFEEEQLCTSNNAVPHQKQFDEMSKDKTLSEDIQKIREQITENHGQIKDLTMMVSEIATWIKDNFQSDFLERNSQ